MSNNNISPGLLSTKLLETIVADLDYKDSEINKYIEAKALNIILTTLSIHQRIEFYELLGKDDHQGAYELVLKYIPDFYLRLTGEVKEKFERIA